MTCVRLVGKLNSMEFGVVLVSSGEELSKEVSPSCQELSGLNLVRSSSSSFSITFTSCMLIGLGFCNS